MFQITHFEMTSTPLPNNKEELIKSVIEGDNNVAHRVEGKKVLRPSSIDPHCPFQWAAQFYGLYESKSRPANTIGTAFHAAAEAFDLLRMVSGSEHLPNNGHLLKEIAEKKIQDTEQKYREKWGSDMWKDNEDSYSRYDSKQRLFDDLEYAIDKLPEFIGSEPVAIATETRFTAHIANHPVFNAISGSIDRLTPSQDGGVVVDDYKFVKSYTQDKLKTYAVQQSIYGWMAQGAGLKLSGNRLLAVNRQATKIAYKEKVNKAGQVYDITENKPLFLKEMLQPNYQRAVSKVQLLLNLTKLTDYYIKGGLSTYDAISAVFPTAGTGDFLCDEKWCDMWHRCPINTGAIGAL